MKQVKEDILIAEAYQLILEVMHSKQNYDRIISKYFPDIKSYPQDQIDEFINKSVKPLIDNFNKVQSNLQNKDILGYKNISELSSAIEQGFKAIREKKQTERERNIIVVNDRVLVIEPLSFAASAKYGANTKWCTTNPSKVSFFNYSKYSYLLYIIDKETNKKYALMIPLVVDAETKNIVASKKMLAFNPLDVKINPNELLAKFNLSIDDIISKLPSPSQKYKTLVKMANIEYPGGYKAFEKDTARTT